MTERCHAAGCSEYADPRFAIHGPDGRAVPACDGHGNPGCTEPCTCPPHDGGEAMTPLPCPFCGSRTCLETKEHFVRVYWVRCCSACRSRGPDGNSKRDAVSAWNRVVGRMSARKARK